MLFRSTIVSAVLFGTSALFFYPVNYISRKIGYKNLMIIFLMMLVVLSLVLFNLGKGIPISWGIVIFGLIGIPISGSAFIFPPAMLSEIVAYSHKKREIPLDGLYFGIQGFFLKFAFLISVGIVPILLVTGDTVGFFEGLVNKPTSIQISGIYNTTLFSCFSFIISILFYWLYPERIERD